MTKVKILVVEDEMIIADSICNTLEKYGYELLDPEISYSDAVKSIVKNQPDLVLIDIQLSGSKSGIDLAKHIQENEQIPFIFLTSFADNATIDEVKKVKPNAYLLKPFNKEELYVSIELAIYNQLEKVSKQKNDVLFVKHKLIFVKINMNDIRYFKSDHVYVEIHTNSERMVVRNSLHEYEHQLNNNFVRVHRSYIVNKTFITSFNTSILNLGDVEIPLSKNYKDLFIAEMQKYASI